MGEMNENRQRVVNHAFETLDAENQGFLEFDYLKDQYMPHNHPDVTSGKKGEEEVFQEFLSTFETHRYNLIIKP